MARQGAQKRIRGYCLLLPDFQVEQAFGILLDVDVDGKVSIDVSHLVLVSLGHTGHQVLDNRLDGSESSNVLSLAMVDFNLNERLPCLVFPKRKGDGDVGEIFGEFACATRILSVP